MSHILPSGLHTLAFSVQISRGVASETAQNVPSAFHHLLHNVRRRPVTVFDAANGLADVNWRAESESPDALASAHR